MADVAKQATIEIPIHTDVGQLSDLSKQLDNIKKQGNNIKKMLDNNIFKGLNNGSDKASKSIKAFTDRSDKMLKSVQNTSNSLQKASDATSKYSDILSKTGDATQRAIDNSDKLGDSTKRNAGSFDESTRKMNEHLKMAQRMTKSVSSAKVAPPTEGMQQFTDKVDRAREASERFSHVGWNMIGVTAGLGASFFKGAKDAATIQQQFKQLTNLAVTSGEKRADVLKKVGEMQKENTALSLKYGISQTDLAKGDEQLVHAGYSTNAALAAHKVLVQGAIASGQSYNDVMNNVTNTLDQYQLRTNNTRLMQQRTNKVMNEMAYAVDHGKASFNDFGETMRYVGATSHSTNQQLAGTMSAISILSKNGLNLLASQTEMAA